METCKGCGEQTNKGLINIEIVNACVMSSNCEHCANPGDYRTPQAWKGASISETATVNPSMQTPCQVEIVESRVVDLTSQESNEVAEAVRMGSLASVAE